MNKKERIPLSMRMKDITARQLPWITGGAVALLCVLILAVIAVTNALDIRAQVEKDLQQQFQVITARVKAVGGFEDVPEENIYSAYQKAMANSSDLDASFYDFLSGSFLMNSAGEIVVQSRNALILQLSEDGETWTEIPMTFPRENTSDVASVLWRDMALTSSNLTVNPKTGSNKWTVITGYWEDHLFWMNQIRKEDFELASPISVSDGKVTEQINVNTLGGTEGWRYLGVTELSKNFGSENFRTDDFVAGWNRVDKLIQKTAEEADFQVRGWWYGGLNQRGSIFSMKSLGFEIIEDPHCAYTASGRLQLVYCTQYSPLGLALGEMLRNKSLILIPLLFLAAGIFLVVSQSGLRKRELGKLEDEIQRQKQALDYARDAEASRREMTSAIAHELKTPIAVLSSYSEALTENIEAEKQGYYLGVIREETEKMDRMVMELLDLSRLEAGKYRLRREKVDLVELVKEIIRPLEGQISEKEITLDWQIGEKETMADRYRFGQVIENYMTNAIRHTPPGGRIILRIGMSRETFSVENTGKKIPADQLSKVWETFWQGDQSRNEGGSGLGLSICRSIMQLHGGSCKAENTSSGVRFTANIQQSQPVRLSTGSVEKVVKLEYPIAQEYTTAERMFLRLRLLNAIEFRREVRAGNVRCGAKTVKDHQEKIYPGSVVEWDNFRITVVLNNELKRKAILINQFGTTGRLSNSPPNVGALGGGGGK